MIRAEYANTLLVFMKTEFKEPPIVFDPDDLCDDIKVTSKPIEDDPHITLMIGLPKTESLDFIKELAKYTPAMNVKAKKLDFFPQDKIFKEDGSRHVYDVLYIDPNDVSGKLVDLNYRMHAHYGLKWEHKDYVPHITLAYLKAGRAAKYLDKPLNEIDICMDHLVIREYKKRDEPPLIVPLGVACSP